MSLNNHPVLHIAYTTTNYSGAIFRDAHHANHDNSANGIKFAFSVTKYNVYIEYVNSVQNDQGSVRRFQPWKEFTIKNIIKLRLCGVPVQSSLGIQEQYYEL